MPTAALPRSEVVSAVSRVGPRWAPVATLAGYLAGSVVLHRRMLSDPSGSAIGALASDAGLFTWWLHWTAWAIGHGQDPLFTTWMNVPDGVNALWNTTVPLLGVLLAPVTATAGPLVSYNLAMVLGPVVSAGLTSAALGLWTRSWPARAVGGAMVGFSPFAIAHATAGHLNLVWTVMPALVLWAVRRVLVEPRHPVRSGLLLGTGFALQILLYTQTVALGALVLLIVAAVLAVSHPREIRARVHPVAVAVAVGVGVALAIAAYPLWLLLAGPGRPRIPIRDVAETGADAANLVVPTVVTALRPGTGSWADRLHSYLGEQGSYLGVVMILVVALGAVVVRDRTVRLAAVVTGLVALASLGTSLIVLGEDTGVGLPWRAVLTIPLVSQAEAVRLAPFVAAGVALVVALLLERAVLVRRWSAVAAIGVAVATWTPADAVTTTRVAVPPFFGEAARHLAPGEIVETWPRATVSWFDGADPLHWQSAAGFAYRQTGGYFIGADDRYPLLLEGTASEYHHGAAGLPADAGRATADLVDRGVGTVLVVPRPDVNLPVALRWTATVTGDPGTEIGGVWVFRLVPGDR